MNRILLRQDEAEGPIIFSSADYRAQHLRQILKAGPESVFEAGVLNTHISGQFRVSEITRSGSICGHFTGAYDASQKRRWQRLCIGLGVLRPLVLKRLLRDFAAAGVEEIALLQAELCEGDYCKSHIWDEFEHHLLLGAEQGRVNRLPRLLYEEHRGLSLAAYLARAKQLGKKKEVLPQNCLVFTEQGCYRSVLRPLAGASGVEESYIMALGPERGWTANELQAFCEHGFTNCSLGPVTLRAEVAAHLALGLYLLETFRLDS